MSRRAASCVRRVDAAPAVPSPTDAQVKPHITGRLQPCSTSTIPARRPFSSIGAVSRHRRAVSELSGRYDGRRAVHSGAGDRERRGQPAGGAPAAGQSTAVDGLQRVWLYQRPVEPDAESGTRELLQPIVASAINEFTGEDIGTGNRSGSGRGVELGSGQQAVQAPEANHAGRPPVQAGVTDDAPSATPGAGGDGRPPDVSHFLPTSSHGMSARQRQTSYSTLQEYFGRLMALPDAADAGAGTIGAYTRVHQPVYYCLLHVGVATMLLMVD